LPKIMLKLTKPEHKMSKILKLLKGGPASSNLLRQTGEDLQPLINNGLIKIKEAFPRITIYEITAKGLAILGDED
jgi:predicted transcriptional regulator